jgi:hypothetical protein
VLPATRTINKPTFSKAELKVQAIAKRRANDQLLRIPWTKFSRAYEEYPRWHALALWVQGIVATQDSVPPWLVAELGKHCPAFVEQEASSREPKLIALHLLEWIHNREFGHAKRQGWLDALTFYGMRHPRSERAWAYWEHCEKQWNREQPNVFPGFDEWWHKALQVNFGGEISHLQVAKAVERYVDWKALLLWLRPLLASDAKLPQHVKSELERRCPGILGRQNSSRREDREDNAKIWRHLIRWGKGHSLSGPKQAALQGVRFHPRYVRFMAYGKHWTKERSRNRAQPYPSFREWQQAADRFIDAGSK